MIVLIVGLGSIAKKHIKALKEISKNTDFFALRHKKSNESFSNNITFLYSHKDLFNYKFDFAIISNPTIFHKDTIKSLIDLKIPLFIEKPLHSDLNIADVIQEIRSKSIPTYVACNLRFYDCIKYVRDHIHNKKTRINEVNAYCGSYLPDWRPDIDYKKVYSAQKTLGGGVHLDLIHELDYIFWLFGSPKRIDKVLRSNSSLEIDSIDYANYVLHYPEFCASIILNYFRRDYKRSFEIIFDDESWLIDLKSNTIYIDDKVIFQSDQTFIDTYKAQLEYFIANLNNDNIMNSIEESYEVLKICL